MKKPLIVAEIELKGRRLYLIHKRGNVETSRTDVTPVWHFFKEVEEYLASPESTPSTEV